MSSFWSWQLIAAMVLNGALQCLTVSAYASRLAGARTGRVATAISLFNAFGTTGRFASMLYTPILGSLADRAGLLAVQGGMQSGAAVALFQTQLRLVVFAGTAGVALGGLLLPTFVMLYANVIASFEDFGDLPRALMRSFAPSNAVALISSLRVARLHSLGRLSLARVPKGLLIMNTFVTSVYGIGIVSAAYASVLDPAAARTALLSSGLVNGLASIAYNIIVDPTSAFITDQSAKNERPIEDVRAMVAGLAITATIGFLLSQLLLVPAAMIIATASRAISAH